MRNYVFYYLSSVQSAHIDPLRLNVVDLTFHFPSNDSASLANIIHGNLQLIVTLRVWAHCAIFSTARTAGALMLSAISFMPFLIFSQPFFR